MAFEDKNDEDDEINFDFSKIKNFFKGKKKEKLEKVEEDIKEKKEEIKELKKEEIETEKKIKHEKAKLSVPQKSQRDFLGKDKEEIKKLEKEEKKIDEERDDDEIGIDFSKIKNIFKFDKKEKKALESKTESDEELGVDFNNVVDFFKTNKYAVPAVLILIAIFFSVFFRMYPAYLPITDDWARDTVNNYYKNQFKAEIDQQYPNLPDANKNTLVENKFQEFLKSNKAQVEQQIKGVSEQFKSNFKYTGEDGKEHLYLSDIDTYLWYGEVKNYLKNGHFGTDIVNGESMNMLRNGREGLESSAGIPFHMYFEAYLYKFVSFFNKNIPLTSVIFVVSVIIIGLSVIPAFFIGRRLGGNIGGFFAGMIVAVNSALLGRTAGGVADTDPWNIFFPLIIMWLFLEAFEAKDLKKQIIYAGLGGFFVGLFSYAWGGWWYPFDFILFISS
jgi:hypothetical protein